MNELINGQKYGQPVYTCHCRSILKMNGFQYLALAKLYDTDNMNKVYQMTSDMP